MNAKSQPEDHLSTFWSLSSSRWYQALQTDGSGLASQEAAIRLKRYGTNQLNGKAKPVLWRLLLSQFKSSIILILLFATGLSFYLGEKVNAIIILIIVISSGMLGFWQEKQAAQAMQKLLALVAIKAKVMRDYQPVDIDIAEVVPGDILLLRAGDIIPADCLVLEANHLFIDEAILTGESFPTEKSEGIIDVNTPLSQRSNALWLGTHVQSGNAKALVIATGHATEFGKLANRLKLKSPETEFERGIRQFGYLLMEITFVMVILTFAINVHFHRPVIDSFMFALALAVGLTPQLLPAVISVNLAHGARRMAEDKVIVKQLTAIENFGSMNVLCSDKTGTLTEGKIQVKAGVNVAGNLCDKVLRFAYLNAYYENGFNNPIDAAIRDFKTFDINNTRKRAEIPYDFYRKRLSLLLSDNDHYWLVTKGALLNVLDVCSHAELEDGTQVPLDQVREPIQNRYEAFSEQGLRTLGVAYKAMPAGNSLNKDDETGLCFLGFITLFDPVKPNCRTTMAELNQLGVSLKIITGDNRLVAKSLSLQLGLNTDQLLTGPEIRSMTEPALIKLVGDMQVFAEIEPNQKERIIFALKKDVFVFGYIVDGINDASALHAADVGISVDSAADVAKETAQILLLEKNLEVLINGVKEGRKTFANTLKYVFMATSANFGNMFSMAGASLFLPFLPLLPKQVLMTNLLTDFPEMTIATDNVDADLINRPHRLDIQFIRKFMITFGFISSLFDYITFGALWWLQVSVEQFRTGWFIESVLSASFIVFIIRTKQPFFASKPSVYLILATLLISAFTLALPFLPLAPILGFQPLPLQLFGIIGMIIFGYMITAEITKHVFYRLLKTYN
jgi:Mg2+-importing ATPase